ncbi:MAG: cytochrome c [Leeuwenhoekiella sp.]
MRLQLHSIPSYLLCIFIFFTSLQVSAKENDKDVQSVIHLLDYLSKDYPMAVSDGEILDKAEYAEMQEFSTNIFNLAKEINLPSESVKSIFSDLNDLKNLVRNRASVEKIKDLAEKAKWAIIKATSYEVAPLNWPDNANGQSLYLQNCIQCHGPKGGGNGNLAIGLKPAPANFLNDSLMAALSPFEAYNTVKLGVEGTAMRAFTELTDKEAWDLAFYVKSLRFQKQKIDSVSLKKTFDQEYGKTSLKDVATLSDNELLNKFGSDIRGQKKLKALRIFSPSGKLSQSSLTIARDYLHQALSSYKKGKIDEARQKALAAYLEGIEPVEVRLKANDPKFTSQLEQKMMDVRQAIEKGKN